MLPHSIENFSNARDYYTLTLLYYIYYIPTLEIEVRFRNLGSRFFVIKKKNRWDAVLSLMGV